KKCTFCGYSIRTDATVCPILRKIITQACTKLTNARFSVPPLCSLCLCGESNSEQNTPSRHDTAKKHYAPSLQTFYELFTPSLCAGSYSSIVDNLSAEAAHSFVHREEQ